MDKSTVPGRYGIDTFGMDTGSPVSNAYQPPFAIASGSRLVSFDAAFARFPGLNFLHLKP